MNPNAHGVKPTPPDPYQSLDLGSPLCTAFGRALLVADDARQRLHEAQIGGQIGAKEWAEYERGMRTAEVFTLKERAVADLFLVVRWAEELYPGRLRELLDQQLRRELDNTQAAVVELASEVAESQAAIVELAEQRGANHVA